MDTEEFNIGQFGSEELYSIVFNSNNSDELSLDETINHNMVKQEPQLPQSQEQLLLLQQQQQQQQHELALFLQQQQQQQEQQLPAPNLGHLSRHPNLIEVKSKYDFEVTVPPDNNIVFIDPKLYIKMNAKMMVNVSYRQQVMNEPLFVRAMIIFSSPAEMHLPVKRCANHRGNSNANMGAEIQARDANILKVNDPKAQYCGDEKGETYTDRLSVVVPLESHHFDENGKITQAIGLEFACQNSCSSGINRRPTSIVFTLETASQELIGKNAIEFKVCSCPKRDSERDKSGSTKRKSNEPFPRGKKPKLVKPKVEPKQEPESESDSSEPNSDQSSFITGLHMNVPTEMVGDILKNTFNMVAGKMAEDSKRANNYEMLEKCLKDLKKQRKALKHN